MRVRVNGVNHDIEAEGGATLVHVLRDHLGLTGTKEACGRGECGSCTVLVDGTPVLACLTLVGRVTGEIRTVEGLGTADDDLRRAFADEGGFQCGFCTPGQVVAAAALLAARTDASEEEVRAAMAGNVCRCTGYAGIVAAVLETARRRATERAAGLRP